MGGGKLPDATAADVAWAVRVECSFPTPHQGKILLSVNALVAGFGHRQPAAPVPRVPVRPQLNPPSRTTVTEPLVHAPPTRAPGRPSAAQVCVPWPGLAGERDAEALDKPFKRWSKFDQGNEVHARPLLIAVWQWWVGGGGGGGCTAPVSGAL